MAPGCAGAGQFKTLFQGGTPAHNPKTLTADYYRLQVHEFADACGPELSTITGKLDARLPAGAGSDAVTPLMNMLPACSRPAMVFCPFDIPVQTTAASP